MHHRRSFSSTLDGIEHRIDVVYAALSGWMSIEVDGIRRARGWREVQTVFGGANLSCELDGHRLDARVTQPWGGQEYAIALAIDGETQPGSDLQPEAGTLKRQTWKAIGLLTLAIFIVTLVTQIYRILN